MKPRQYSKNIPTNLIAFSIEFSGIETLSPDFFENKWDQNFINEIKIVVGDEWYAGNLSYHLISRPMWTNELKNKTSQINSSVGVIYVGNSQILKKICPGVYGTIKPVGYCMIGQK